MDIRQAIQSKRPCAKVSTPAISPDFNPIELGFSKLNALERATTTRTVPELWDVIDKPIDHFTPNDCKNYFAPAGYDAF